MLNSSISILMVLLVSIPVYADGELQLLTTITIDRPNTKISSVIPVGDFNNDGYDDLLLGVWPISRIFRGGLFVLWGNKLRLRTRPDI